MSNARTKKAYDRWTSRTGLGLASMVLVVLLVSPSPQQVAVYKSEFSFRFWLCLCSNMETIKSLASLLAVQVVGTWSSLSIWLSVRCVIVEQMHDNVQHTLSP